MRHELKIWPTPFAEIAAGRKQYEIRRNDRDYEIGDELDLREWHPVAEIYTGRSIEAEVVHITNGGRFGLPAGMCVLGLINVQKIDNA